MSHRVAIVRVCLVAGRALVVVAFLLVCAGLVRADGPLGASQPGDDSVARAALILETRCLRCHDAQKHKGELDLSTRAGLLRGGESGPSFDAAQPEASLLLRVIRHLAEPYMPHEEDQLAPAAIEDVAAWLRAGAPYSRTLAARWPGSNPAAFADFWSFRALAAPEPPAVQHAEWVRTPIDAFVLARLEARQLMPAPPADRPKLIRRATFDLVGLPPTPEEIAAFVADPAADAYERLVDRLLASPHYGERWGRHWLDVARYADSNGFEGDEDRPAAYAYRDFVIRALNDDLPFDRFVRWQLAGDELAPEDLRAWTATGFCAAGPLLIYSKNDGTPLERLQSHYNELDDLLSTTGSALLGLTIACARCHDHKFDPISQHDYYRMLSAFITTTRREQLNLPPEQAADYQRRDRDYKQALAAAEKALNDFLAPARERVRLAKIDELEISDSDKALLRAGAAAEKRRKELAAKFKEQLRVSDGELQQQLDEGEQQRWKELAAEFDRVKATRPPDPPRAYVLTDSQPEPLPNFFLERGEVDRQREPLALGFLSVLAGNGPVELRRPEQAKTTFQRAALADWLTRVDTPTAPFDSADRNEPRRGAGHLLARVLVNRLWQHHFGEGLVRTPNDFGQQGDRPSHPELLDWLAGRLIAGGWRLKPLHKLIMLSAAYCQDTTDRSGAITGEPASTADPRQVDPENRLLWHRRPQRLEAEILRDAMLAVSGSLDEQMFGPAVKPAIPAEAMAGRNKDDKVPRPKQDGPEQWRRSIYLFVKRSIPTPLLETFDAPGASASCGRRTTSTVAPQALALLNDPFVRSQAQRFAQRLAREVPADRGERIDCAFRLALGRPPTDEQRLAAAEFLGSRDDEATWTNFCQTLFTLNEFVYVD